MTRLKLRENGEEKGTYTEESVAFGNALWDFLIKPKTKEPTKNSAQNTKKSDESAK